MIALVSVKLDPVPAGPAISERIQFKEVESTEVVLFSRFEALNCFHSFVQ